MSKVSKHFLFQQKLEHEKFNLYMHPYVSTATSTVFRHIDCPLFFTQSRFFENNGYTGFQFKRSRPTCRRFVRLNPENAAIIYTYYVPHPLVIFFFKKFKNQINRTRTLVYSVQNASV